MASASWGSLWTFLAAEPDGFEGRVAVLSLVNVTEDAVDPLDDASSVKGHWMNA